MKRSWSLIWATISNEDGTIYPKKAHLYLRKDQLSCFAFAFNWFCGKPCRHFPCYRSYGDHVRNFHATKMSCYIQQHWESGMARSSNALHHKVQARLFGVLPFFYSRNKSVAILLSISAFPVSFLSPLLISCGDPRDPYKHIYLSTARIVMGEFGMVHCSDGMMRKRCALVMPRSGLVRLWQISGP